jgi:hypothetical protein
MEHQFYLPGITDVFLDFFRRQFYFLGSYETINLHTSFNIKCVQQLHIKYDTYGFS